MTAPLRRQERPPDPAIAAGPSDDPWSSPEINALIRADQDVETAGSGDSIESRVSAALDEWRLRDRELARRSRARPPLRRRGAGSVRTVRSVRREMWPVRAPGMPPPGRETLAIAASLLGLSADGLTVEDLSRVDLVVAELYDQMLRARGDVHAAVAGKRGEPRRRMAVVCGHRWGDPNPSWPPPCDVMVVGKCLGKEEKASGRCFVGPTGDLLADMCDELGIQPGDWYVTNLLKTEHPSTATGSGDSKITASQIEEWLPLLHQELRLVRPRYLLCLGADAVDAVIRGSLKQPGVQVLDRTGEPAFPGKTSVSVKAMEGRVVELRYPVQRDAEGLVRTASTLVMAATHPAAVLYAPDKEDELRNALARFGQLVAGNRPDQEEDDLDHRELDTLAGLLELEQEILATCEDNLIAVDAEWHGDHPQEPGAYLRTIQLSWRHKTACCVHIHAQGGEWRFDGTKEELVETLSRMLKGRRIAGHFLNADLEWLLDLGIDLRDDFEVSPDGWERCFEEATRRVDPRGGIDTGLAAHAIHETADFGLTPLSLRYTTAPRYDVSLIRWRDQFCNEHGLKKQDLEGYGECPDEVLVPYANYDADVTRRLAVRLQQLLTRDAFGHCSWESFWTKMRANMAALEMNLTGILVDRKRMDQLTVVYMAAQDRLRNDLRKWARWPEFNPNSLNHVREFLFGEGLNGKKPSQSDIARSGRSAESWEGVAIRLRPQGARSLRLTPTLTTGKRPLPWDEAVEKGLDATPATGRIALSLLAQENQEVLRTDPRTGKTLRFDLSQHVRLLQDYRFVAQALRSTLRTPLVDEEGGDFITDDEDNFTYDGAGLPASICADGRVRSHFYPTKETGRWGSARPPLHNLSKRRESDYRRILGEEYSSAIRSILMAQDGYCLVEADYSGAELFGMAIMAGDRRMIADIQAGADTHSQIAVLAFRLACPPTKAGLQSVPNPRNPADPDGCLYLRNVAKSVIFGLAYGRQAKAIALAAKEEGIPLSVSEAQAVIDAVFALYPSLEPFFEECKRRALQERWICGVGGQFRRFPRARDFKSEGDLERQAMNFPIQNLVADVVNRACDHFLLYRKAHPSLDYRIVLQLHDALMFEVAWKDVPAMIDTVIPECMERRVEIWPTALNGVPTGDGPYQLKAEIDAPARHWGEVAMPDYYMRAGIPLRLTGWKEMGGGYVNKKYPNQVWRDGVLSTAS